MDLFSRVKKVFPSKQAGGSQDANKNQDNLIKIYDEYGREFLITKEEWRKNVLPGNLKRSWNDPEKLYQDIVMALRDEHFQDVLAASERLLAIDNDKERSYIIRSILLMKNGKLKKAKEILQDYINKYGETGYILTNLAKVYAEEKDQVKTEQILWKGLQLDPNQDNGLGWWLAICKEKNGQTAYLEELKKIAEINGSWRAQLWLAVEALKEKNISAAKKYYEHVLSRAMDVPGVLMAISGDLGKAGYYDEIFSLILPIYDPEKHDVQVGFNILQAYLESKKYAEGRQYLKRMYSLNRPDIHDNLTFYSDKFYDNTSNLPRDITDPGKISAEIVSLDKPIFYYGLKDADWLLPEVTRNGPKIVIMPLANINAGNKMVMQREDDIGRLTRSIPLYIGEKLFFETNCSTQVLIPVTNDGSVITTGTEYDVDYLLAGLAKRKENNVPDIYVSGTIKDTDNTCEVVISIWDCKSRQKIKSISQNSEEREIGKLIKELADELFKYLDSINDFKRVKPINYYRPLDNTLVGGQLLAYGQAFILVLASNKLGKKESIFGESGIIRNPLDLSLMALDILIPKILFISNLAKAFSYHSDVLAEFKKYAIKLISDNKNDEYIVKLSPLVYKIFAMEQEFNDFEKNIGKYPKSYQDWFGKLKVGEEKDKEA